MLKKITMILLCLCTLLLSSQYKRFCNVYKYLRLKNEDKPNTLALAPKELAENKTAIRKYITIANVSLPALEEVKEIRKVYLQISETLNVYILFETFDMFISQPYFTNDDSRALSSIQYKTGKSALDVFLMDTIAFNEYYENLLLKMMTFGMASELLIYDYENTAALGYLPIDPEGSVVICWCYDGFGFIRASAVSSGIIKDKKNDMNHRIAIFFSGSSKERHLDIIRQIVGGIRFNSITPEKWCEIVNSEYEFPEATQDSGLEAE